MVCVTVIGEKLSYSVKFFGSLTPTATVSESPIHIRRHYGSLIRRGALTSSIEATANIGGFGVNLSLE